jgi:hemerythrin-like domain-containing protein
LSTNTETRDQAWQRRTAAHGEVDFTMMYVGHDALVRDLSRLLAAARAGSIQDPRAAATWQAFSAMLRLHHEAEDAALWPPLAAAVSGTPGADVIDAMEAEHRSIDPLLELVDARLAAGEDVTEPLEALWTGLTDHLRHEETTALPLLAATLGADGWARFVDHYRRQVGAERLPTVLPWMLDGAPEAATGAVLRSLPPALAAAYADHWQPAYAAAPRLF